MKKQITRTDIIIEAFGVTSPDLQRLVELETKIQRSVALADTDLKDWPEAGMETVEIMEWKRLMDKYYDNAVQVLKNRGQIAN